MLITAKYRKHPWLTIGKRAFYSRLLIGFEQYRSHQTLDAVLRASKVEIFIIGIGTAKQMIEDKLSIDKASLAMSIDLSKYTIIGTTSFSENADEAIQQGLVLSELVDDKIIKLDVRTRIHGYPFPDNMQTIQAARELIRHGCVVLPMINPNIDDALQLQDLGCPALRILVGKIGSGSGIEDPKPLKAIADTVKVPIIAEGGISKPSDIAVAFEAGADAVLINTAIAQSSDPAKMARALRLCVEASCVFYGRS